LRTLLACQPGERRLVGPARQWPLGTGSSVAWTVPEARLA